MAGAALRALAVLALVAWTTPWWPSVPSPLLDSGWKLGLSVACERGLVFGRDLVFTYGPFGCLITRQYWPSLYEASVAFNAILAAIAAWLVLDAGRGARERLAGLAALLWLGSFLDTAMLALPLAYAWNAARTKRRSVAGTLALAALAPLALAKFLLLPLAIVAVLASALARDRKPWRGAVLDLVGFGAALMLSWVAAQQPVDALVPYLRNALEVAREYPQAMAWPGPWDRVGVIAFAAQLAAAALAIATAALVLGQPRERGEAWRQRGAWALYAGAALFLGLRHGTTRGDPQHLAIATSVAGALALLAWPCAVRNARSLGLVILAAAAATLALSELRFQGKGGGVLAAQAAATARGLGMLARGHDPRAGLDERLQAARRALDAERATLPMIDASYDVLGQDQYLILALGTERWTPRPSLQGYSAYAPGLAQLDADFLAGPGAPRWLIASVQTIDARLAMMDDAAIWPVVRRRYEIAARAGERLVLRRIDPAPPVPASRSAAGAAPSRIAVPDWTPVPAAAGGSLWARIEIDAGAGDALRTALWKPPVRYLELRTAGAPAPRRFRIVPKAAAAGFLLSPEVTGADALERWLRGRAQPDAQVVQMRVVDESGEPVGARVTLGPGPFPPP
jgi:hypothetical protein